MKLFEKHGMTNLIYWNLTHGRPEREADNTLVYLLAHKSQEAGQGVVRRVPRRPGLARRPATASEEKAGGSLTDAANRTACSRIYCVPTDYSPLK